MPAGTTGGDVAWGVQLYLIWLVARLDTADMFVARDQRGDRELLLAVVPLDALGGEDVLTSALDATIGPRIVLTI